MNVSDYVLETRRKLHQCPELSDKEFLTTDFIEKELQSMGIKTYRLLETGVIGELIGKKAHEIANPTRNIAFRADIDGLKLEERTGLNFMSKNSGVMHACGHDAHTAILLATALSLTERLDEFSDNVKFIFQPAEEGNGGAKRLIEKGCLSNPKVDRIYGLHVMPSIDSGKIGIRYGKMFAACDTVNLSVKGASGHGAFPEKAIDAIMVASNFITSIQSVVSRNISPVNPCVITFGKINGGSANNIIADQVEIQGTVRTVDKTSREYVKNRIEDMAKGIAIATGANIEVEYIKGYDPLINHNIAVDEVLEAGKAVLKNDDNVVFIEDYFMGGEDFSFYVNETVGAFFGLGSGYIGKVNKDLHTKEFEIDEACLMVGVRVLENLVK